MKNILKRVFYTFAGLPSIHYLGHPWRGRACVLCYHRVLPDDEFEGDKSPMSNLIVPVSKFKEQMKFLSEEYDVVSLDELTNSLDRKWSNNFFVAITFDDGYKDNLKYAVPVLEKFNNPAAIFITTRFPEGDTWMWWYEVWDYLQTIDMLKVNYMGRIDQWLIKDQIQKKKCYLQLCKRILDLDYEHQMELVSVITSSKNRKNYEKLVLNWDEIKELDSNPLITIGAHTHSHPNLSRLNKEDVYFEMSSSKCILEEKLNHSIDHFAYPFGSYDQASFREFKVAEDCGFKTAVTMRHEVIDKFKPYKISRLTVEPNTSANNLKVKISGIENMAYKILNTLKY